MPRVVFIAVRIIARFLFLFRFSILSKYEMSMPAFLVVGTGEEINIISHKWSPMEQPSPLSRPACHSRSLPEALTLGPAFCPGWIHEGAIVL